MHLGSELKIETENRSSQVLSFRSFLLSRARRQEVWVIKKNDKTNQNKETRMFQKREKPRLVQWFCYLCVLRPWRTKIPNGSGLGLMIFHMVSPGNYL